MGILLYYNCCVWQSGILACETLVNISNTVNKDNHLISEAYKIIREQTFSRATPGGGSEEGYYDRSGQPVITQSTPGKLPAFFAVGQDYYNKPTGGFSAVTVPPVSVDKTGDINFNADVLFDFNSDALKPEGKKQIEGLAAKIKQAMTQVAAPTEIMVGGHTDLYELKPGVNLQLSKRRADAVVKELRTLLSGMGIKLNVTAVAHGSRNPVVKDLPYPIQGGQAPEQGKKQQAPNRRVSLTFNPPLPEPARKFIIQDIPTSNTQSFSITSKSIKEMDPRTQQTWLNWAKQRNPGLYQTYLKELGISQ